MTMQRLKRVAKRVLRPADSMSPPQMTEFERVYAVRQRFLTPITQPLLMVSQVQRSGGTLLSQLLDGHPQLHAHPHELYIGYPKKFNYPHLDLSATPAQWFTQLHEEPALRHFHNGYEKHPESAQYDATDVFPFLLLPQLQRALFLYAAADAKTQRQILDAYWTSYFNAWLDNQNLYGEKRYVAGFVPRMSSDADNMLHFFTDYPNGKLVSVIREPKGWYASSHRQGPQAYPNPQVALPYWMQSAEAMLRNQQHYGERVRVIAFDALLKDTEGVMRAVAAWAGLDWDAILTEPTFQRQPIKANTAYSTAQYGVIAAPLERHTVLDAADAAYIDDHAAALYDQVLALAE